MQKEHLAPAQVVAARTELELEGKTYLAKPLTERYLIEFDDWLQKEVVRIAIEVGKEYDTATADRLLDRALIASSGISWTTHEGNKVLNTPNGFA